MNKEQVIERLCKLASEVGEEMWNGEKSHDCFCHKSMNDDAHFHFDERVLEYIESVVRNELRKDNSY
jgi:hypothetical protein